MLILYFAFISLIQGWELPTECSTDTNTAQQCCDSINNQYGVNSCTYEGDKVKTIELKSTSLTGTIPVFSAQKFTGMTYLDLSSNSLEGPVAASTFNLLTGLETLNISRNNGLNSNFPADIPSLTTLRAIDVSYCTFSGAIPSLGALSQLQVLYASNNLFSDANGLIETSPQTKLEVVDLSKNMIIGTLNGRLGDITTLKHMDLSNNLYTDFLDLGPLVQLTHLDVSHNQISNRTTDTWSTLGALTYLDLSDNKFFGKIPPSMRSLTNLQHFNFSHNLLADELHPDFENWVNIKTVDVNTNHLAGILDKGFAKWTKIESLNLAGNNFESEIPEDWSSMTNLVTLNLRDNKLFDNLPAFLTSLEHIVTMDLADNVLKGSIPEKLKNLKNAKFLDLSQNDFTGTIPDLSDMNMDTLNAGMNVYLQCPVRDYRSFATNTDYEASYGSDGTDNCGTEPSWTTLSPNHHPGNDDDDSLGGGYIFLIVLCVLGVIAGASYLAYQYMQKSGAYEFEYRDDGQDI